MQLADSLGDSAFMHLLHKAEQRVDAAIARKHAAVREALRAPTRVPKRLRLYLSSSHANQSDQIPAAEAPPGIPSQLHKRTGYVVPCTVLFCFGGWPVRDCPAWWSVGECQVCVT